MKIIITLVTGLFFISDLNAQINCPNLQTVTKQELRTNISLPSYDRIRGYVEHVPDGYWNNSNINYPLVIFIPTVISTGNGTVNDLCNLFDPSMNYPPYLIEQDRWPKTMTTVGGQSYPFITLSPQFTEWTFAEIALGEFIQYAIENYRVNVDRIYLVGASKGAEIIQNYVGFNAHNANKIAAIVPIASCKYISDATAQVIGSSRVGYWTSQCVDDLMCDFNAALTNRNKVNQNSSDNRAVLSNFPEAGVNCLPEPHDTWSILLDQNYRKNISGRSMNIFDFMINYSLSSVLPVSLSHFEVNVQNNQPLLSWKTTQEVNGNYFYIERATEEGEFKKIDSVKIKNESSGAAYSWIDQHPLKGKSQYRLSQTDLDGSITYFSIKWVTIESIEAIRIIENPIRSQLVVEVLIPAERNYLRVIDLKGRILYQQNVVSNQTIRINSSSWNNGMYILQYGNTSLKVMKQ